ncbi:uncharacterized protein GIQ15_04653 [Arthroderma uncinatum]|uniref:uncharacterized protein n=1 Tax=Arthroderma uncinatum TaxID=74035 RepID=UPI00144AF40D|nr:uncharacterized protein GIQ15_04653 [Arthroderma uncinatum]KAF3481894.1 hypothetical protein GIQ15_04653 [Arthroderma uncinatum]
MDYTTRMLSSPPKDPKSAVLIDADRENRSISWLEYVSTVKRIAVGLRDAGLAEGDGVGLLSVNEIYYYVLGDGVIAAGGIFAPLPTTSLDQLGLYIEAAQVSWLFVSVEFLEDILLAAPNWKLDKTRILVFDPPGLEPYSGRLPKFSNLLSAEESRFKNPYEGKDPKKLICVRSFGSGTTGSIKAIEISHAAQLARLDAALFAPDPRDTAWLQNIGLSHVSSLNMCNRACAGGLPMALTSVVDAPSLLDRMKAFSISQIQLSPALMESITETVKSGLRPADALQTLSTVLVGGTFSRKVSVEEFSALLPSHTRLRTGYGSTEAGIVTMTPIDAPWELGYTGVLTPKVELKIVDIETGKELSLDTPGEIVIRSPEMMSGFCNNPTATKEAFLPDVDGRGPWLKTGDKGFVDPANGQLVLHARYHELIKIGTETVLPVDVDEVLMTHPSIKKAAITSVVARDDELDLEIIAYIIVKDGASITAQELVDYAASKLPKHCVPIGGVIFTNDLPRSFAGKVQRRNLIHCPVLPGSTKRLSISSGVEYKAE